MLRHTRNLTPVSSSCQFTYTQCQEQMYTKMTAKNTAHIPLRLTSASAEEPEEDKLRYINLKSHNNGVRKHIVDNNKMQ